MSLSEADHTALSNAIESGDHQLVESLIQRHPELVNHPAWTPPPIHCAILWDQPKIVELLLDHGANIEMLDPDRKTTPLRYAIMYCKTNTIPLLLSRGANADSTVENGSSALQLAQNAANGAYQEFDDLPPADKYRSVVTLLQQSGLAE